jgi:trimeric autotransporter adhesin
MLKLKSALLASILFLPLLAGEALAATAGVTAAVNQNAKSIPPGGGVRTIVLGDNVVQDERIETDGAGLVQILLADGTTFTVGPNSSLVIDRFVYDPDANTAEVAASLGRGVFRFIGGRTSKTEGGVTLNTPVGTVGIRGGMADLNFSGTGGNIAQIDLLFGNEITLNGPNGGDRLFQPGYSIVIGPNGRPAVVKTPPGSASIIQQALAGRPGSTGGASQQPSDDDVEESGVDEANSGSTPPDPQDIPPPDLTIWRRRNRLIFIKWQRMQRPMDPRR